jgi:hypothetical protein
MGEQEIAGLGTKFRWTATRSLGKYGKQELWEGGGAAGKRKANDRMGRAYEEGDEEATSWAKGKKSFQIWLMQPDIWKGNKGLEEEEEDNFYTSM